MHRDIVRRLGKKTRQIDLIRGQKQHIRRTADAQPSNILQRRSLNVLAAHGGEFGKKGQRAALTFPTPPALPAGRRPTG